MKDGTEKRLHKLSNLWFVNMFTHSYGELIVQVKLWELLPGVLAKDEFHERLSFIIIQSPSSKSNKSIIEELRIKAMENANVLKKLKRMQLN